MWNTLAFERQMGRQLDVALRLHGIQDEITDIDVGRPRLVASKELTNALGSIDL